MSRAPQKKSRVEAASGLERVNKAIRAAIVGGRAGDRLPPVRALVRELRVSPVTVERAISLLVREGLCVARPGDGTFIASQRAESRPVDLAWQSVALGAGREVARVLERLLDGPPAGVLSLASGYLDEAAQPLAALRAAMSRASRRPGAWSRMPTEGVESLREWFARDAGAAFKAHDVVVVPGGQAALSTAFRALTTPGSAVLVESPTYVGAIAAARAAGLTPVPVAGDAEGVRPDLLAAAFAQTRARLFYTQPTFANPSGAVLSRDRRRAVLSAAAAAGAFVLEDDYARDLALEGNAPPPLAADDEDGRVVYVRSLTKAAAPSLRVGAVCARGAAYARVRSARVVDDFFVPGPLQETAIELVSSPAWPRHLRALRAELRARRDALLATLASHAPSVRVPLVPRGGFAVWVALPAGTDDAGVARAALERGVRVTEGGVWFPAEAPGPFLRVSYASASAATLREGIVRLAKIIEKRR